MQNKVIKNNTAKFKFQKTLKLAETKITTAIFDYQTYVVKNST
jgi:hypothetical protein